MNTVIKKAGNWQVFNTDRARVKLIIGLMPANVPVCMETFRGNISVIVPSMSSYQMSRYSTACLRINVRYT
jgi:hypothetical protein